MALIPGKDKCHFCDATDYGEYAGRFFVCNACQDKMIEISPFTDDAKARIRAKRDLKMEAYKRSVENE